MVPIARLDLETALNLLNAIIIISVSIPTLYIGTKVKVAPLRTIAVLLPTFLVVHGLYHLSAFLGGYLGYGQFSWAGDIVLEPLSYALLLAFAVYFYRSGG
jgi:hypothetical protein